jgi:hypothetical protein
MALVAKIKSQGAKKSRFGARWGRQEMGMVGRQSHAAVYFSKRQQVILPQFRSGV